MFLYAGWSKDSVTVFGSSCIFLPPFLIYFDRLKMFVRTEGCSSISFRGTLNVDLFSFVRRKVSASVNCKNVERQLNSRRRQNFNDCPFRFVSGLVRRSNSIRPRDRNPQYDLNRRYKQFVFRNSTSTIKYDNDLCNDYPCDQCHKTFICFRTLKSHKENDCGRSYECPKCSKSFFYLASYYRHKKKCL